MKVETTIDNVVTLDACGLYCPEPVMMLHKKFREIAPGTVVEVLATDPSTGRDIPKFCQFLGHELLVNEQDGNTFRYRIRKKSD